MSGKDTNDQITQLFGDSGADLDEMAQLRDRIDQVQGDLTDEDGSDEVVVVIGKAFDVTRVLVEQGIYKTRHRGRDPVDQGRLMSIVAANVAYLQATVNAFSDDAQPR